MARVAYDVSDEVLHDIVLGLGSMAESVSHVLNEWLSVTLWLSLLKELLQQLLVLHHGGAEFTHHCLLLIILLISPGPLIAPASGS